MKYEDMENSVEYGSGNIFLDMGRPDPEERLVKTRLTMQINDLIDQRKLTKKKVAELFELDKEKVAFLLDEKFYKFTISKLLKFLNLLGQTIDLTFIPVYKVKKKPQVKAVAQRRVKIAPDRVPMTKSQPAMRAKKRSN